MMTKEERLENEVEALRKHVSMLNDLLATAISGNVYIRAINQSIDDECLYESSVSESLSRFLKYYEEGRIEWIDSDTIYFHSRDNITIKVYGKYIATTDDPTGEIISKKKIKPEFAELVPISEFDEPYLDEAIERTKHRFQK